MLIFQIIEQINNTFKMIIGGEISENMPVKHFQNPLQAPSQTFLFILLLLTKMQSRSIHTQ